MPLSEKNVLVPITSVFRHFILVFLPLVLVLSALAALYAGAWLNTLSGRIWIISVFVLLAVLVWIKAYLTLRYRKESQLNGLILDSLSAHLAVLNKHGDVVLVNQAWQNFAQQNGMSDPKAGLGVSYLNIAREAKGDDAGEAPNVAENLQAMLAGEKEAFSVEYPCHGQDKKRWFQMQASAFTLGQDRMVVIAHSDITGRRLAEERLSLEMQATRRANQALALTQMALEQTEIGEFWIDAESARIIRVNDQACSYLGYTRDELLNLQITAIVPGYTLGIFKAHAAKLRKQGWSRFETSNRTKDGRIIPIEINLTYSQDGDTDNDLLIAFATDITERKQAEAKLIHTINENKLLLDTLNEQLLYSVANTNGHIVDVNDYFCRISGYVREEIIGQSHQMFSSGVHDDAFWAGMWQTIKSGKAWRGDICNRARDGSLFWVDTVIAPFINAEGQIESYVSLRADITLKKQAAQALEKANQTAQEQVHLLQALNQAETWYRFIIESSDDAIIGKDLDGTIKSWNPGAEMIFGYSAEQAIGQSSLILIPPDKRNEDAEFMQLVQQGKTIHHHETRRLRKDGSLIEASVSMAPIFDVSGKLIGASKIVRDITEHKQLENTLLEAKHAAESANQAKSAFISTMSHEIRTPLNAIIGMAYLLHRTALSHDQKEQVDAIQVSSRILLALINDILDLSKIEAGELTLDNHPLILSAVVGELRTMFSVLAEPKGLLLDMPPPETEVPAVVEGDETRLRQMLINLINNAIKFTAQGRVSLNIGLISKDDAAATVLLRFAVTDTGIGIAPEAQAKLFTPFTQVDPSVTRKYGGSGLGLSIVRRLAEEMGGRVGLESQPAQGSTFWFELPMKISSETPRHEDYIAGHPLHVLIAEDDKHQRQILGAMAQQFGWMVDAVDDGRAVVTRVLESAASKHPIDCVILDWKMPHLDGLDVLALLKTKFDDAQIPAIVMTTAYDHDALRRAAGTEPPVSILAKPINASILFDAVNKAVASHGQGHDRMLDASLIRAGLHRCLPGVRVLVVDDSRLNLDVCRRILVNEGCLVTLSESAEDALNQIRGAPDAFDAVLMDIQMPIMDGCEVTRRIRKQLGLSTLPVIALTAGAMASEREQAIAAGMDDFLTKPLDPPRLVSLLRRHIEHKLAKPLPIEPRENPKAESQPAWPKITGIDATRAASNMDGDVEFFAEILRMFVNEYAKAAKTITALLNDGDRQRSADLLHRLKGSAGNVGAFRLIECAGALEQAIRQNAPDQEQLFADFESEHARLIDSATAWLVTIDTAAERLSQANANAEPDWDQLRPLMPEMERLLAANRFEAGKLSKRIEALVADTPLAGLYQSVAKRVAGLQYNEALTAFREFQTFLAPQCHERAQQTNDTDRR